MIINLDKLLKELNAIGVYAPHKPFPFDDSWYEMHYRTLRSYRTIR